MRLADRFVIQKVLGRGATGSVYRAYDDVRKLTVALKFLTAFDPGSLFRFKSEFRTLANLVHPNLVRLYELFSHEDGSFLSMELIDGCDFQTHVRFHKQSAEAVPANDVETEVATVVTLASRPESTQARARAASTIADASNVDTPQRVSQSIALSADSLYPLGDATLGFDEQRLRGAFIQLCDGLQCLHRAHKLHRDVKPANVLVSTADGRVVICDFGLALEAAREPGQGAGLPGTDQASESRFEADHREVAGTLVFMSPEQAKAESLTPASDWYAVGVMLYLALTGRTPHEANLPYAQALRSKLHSRIKHPQQWTPRAPLELCELALALMQIEPSGRPGYAEIVATLEGKAHHSSRQLRQRARFVGREAELAQLRAAFEASRSGRAQVAIVTGTSGMGKSAVVRHFLTELEHQANALVFRARCYEREELPHKAVDPLIDAISSYLVGVPEDEVADLLPPGIEFLSALFPALARVRSIAKLATSSLSVTDPRERRRLAFQAFRALCKRVSQRRPLVLSIDDMQWGDLDSAPIFQELLAPPDPPGLLLVCAYRSEDAQRNQLLSALRGVFEHDHAAGAVTEIVVNPLTVPQATKLALSLLPNTSSVEMLALALARESEGSPFFVGELAAHAREHGVDAAGRIRLDMLMREKLSALAGDSRQLLSVIAVAGRPIAHSIVAAVYGDNGSFSALRDLEARRLVSTSRATGEERIECSHDRIREAALLLLAPGDVTLLHRGLAMAFEAEGSEDFDALYEHWRGAQEYPKATEYALRGARRAETALAFGHAVELYRHALELLDPSESRVHPTRARLGHALILAGRGVEAADVFRALTATATPADAITFRMLATTQLLRGGKLVEGFEELSRASDLFDVRFPRSEATALAQLLVRRARIRWKGRAIEIGSPAGPSDPRVARLDALWEVAAAVQIADLLRGGVYGAELMLRAIELRDPSAIAGACGLEAVTAAASDDGARTQRMLELAEQASDRSNRLDIAGRVRAMVAICRQLQGRWNECIAAARDSQELMRRGATVNWDLAITIWWEMTSAAFVGDIKQLVSRVPEALRDAETRGDVYAATSFRTHRCSWAWLAADRPDLADHEIDIAERFWTPEGYQFQHWHMTYARSETDLYRGTPARAHERLMREWRRGRFVRQVKAVRVDMLYTRARLCLAMACARFDRKHVRQAIEDGRELSAMRAPWARALGKLVLAGAATFDDRAAAIRLFEAVEREFESVDMGLHAELARLRVGQLRSGREGFEICEVAFARAGERGVANPVRFYELLLPGSGC
ncbi:MAG TPA: AAA family ATPase [Polyangiales bacterium]|nr:AAA family ATPase [Polyangiales bacterium]